MVVPFEKKKRSCWLSGRYRAECLVARPPPPPPVSSILLFPRKLPVHSKHSLGRAWSQNHVVHAAPPRKGSKPRSYRIGTAPTVRGGHCAPKGSDFLNRFPIPFHVYELLSVASREHTIGRPVEAKHQVAVDRFVLYTWTKQLSAKGYLRDQSSTNLESNILNQIPIYILFEGAGQLQRDTRFQMCGPIIDTYLVRQHTRYWGGSKIMGAVGEVCAWQTKANNGNKVFFTIPWSSELSESSSSSCENE